MTFTYSWIYNQGNSAEKSQLMLSLNNYVPKTREMIKASVKHVVPSSDICMVYQLCRLMESLLVPENNPANVESIINEIYFVFATIWTFDGA
jgi:dynein heavy chain